MVKRMERGGEDVAGGTGMLPPPPVDMSERRRKRKAKVLDEDLWVKQLELIIERDYFPEIPKLQSKLEWLRAMNSGDEERIRRAQRNNALRRAGIRAPMDHETDFEEEEEEDSRPVKEWATPLRRGEEDVGGSEWDESVLSRDRRHVPRDEGTSGAGSPALSAIAEPKALPLSLDQFCRKHTSEDNASFSDLLEKANSKVRAKRDTLSRSVRKLEGGTSPPCSTDGYGTSNQPQAGLLTWKHKTTNALFFPREIGSSEVSAKERKTLYVRGPERSIVPNNTRVQKTSTHARAAPAAIGGKLGHSGGDFLDSPSTSVSLSASVKGTPLLPQSFGQSPGPNHGAGRAIGAGKRAAAVAGDLVKERMVDDLRGYRFVRSPTPASLDEVGVGEREVQEALAREGERQFNIKPVSERERLAMDLGAKSSHQSASIFKPSKSRNKSILGKASGYLRSPSVPSAHGTPLLSPAGQRLASRMKKTPKHSSRFSRELRASYTPTPSRDL